METRKYPIGIQDFVKLREDGYVYVDKTAYVYQLAQEANPFFLSRPRRFGKSLLLSTLKAYFEGKRALFSEIAGQPALAIAGLEQEWLEYPVLHIDFNTGNYHKAEELDSVLNAHLARFEEKWGSKSAETNFSMRFMGVIERAA
ncbi:MAG: AAA family ATPase, partial [Spirochaetaceae bacterium]|nr:AAA family ATPase [Spirochaetaceae bacterium]